MMEKEYERAKKAYEEYNLNDRYNLTEEILEYIKQRIEANREEIEKLMKIYKRKNTYEEIKYIIEKEIEEGIEYKTQTQITKREDGFIKAKYMVSRGVVIVESYDLIESIKYMIRAIKTRNAVIISDIEYEEKDDKHLIALIINEAYKKFDMKEELIQILPYEECDYEKSDKVICTYDRKNERTKEEDNKKYVYIEDIDLRKEAMKEYEELKLEEKEVEFVNGNINEVIDRLNKKLSYAVVIYTKDPKKGYKFINLVKSKNVFVNATLANVEDVPRSENELLMYKNIMYELKNDIL